MANGKFIISLDFELMWGVMENKNKTTYGENILGVHTAIPRLLDLFDKYGIKATFSTVGFLFFENKQELLNNLPAVLPEYENKKLSPYNNYLDTLGNDDKDDPYHFGYKLLQLIQQRKEHEIGTHTFCHYYCLEKGQTIDAFREDIQHAVAVAKKKNIEITSLVFPRNQFNDGYLKVCADAGIICYRGNEHSWIYKAMSRESESLLRRALRLADAYINISGHNCYTTESLKNKYPVDIPSSRFLRPYSKKLKFLDALRLKRITSAMTHAAKENMLYHIWWHPHNFGINQDENFAFLEKILQHFKILHERHNFESLTMTDFAKRIN